MAEPPAVCTLAAEELKERRAFIRELSRAALLASRRTPLTLELTYHRSAADRVRALVRRERTCCAFLEFELAEGATGVQLTITAPERARDAAESLFAQFAATAESAPTDDVPTEKEPT